MNQRRGQPSSDPSSAPESGTVRERPLPEAAEVPQDESGHTVACGEKTSPPKPDEEQKPARR
jgi:hypothetical protein